MVLTMLKTWTVVTLESHRKKMKLAIFSLDTRNCFQVNILIVYKIIMIGNKLSV